MELNERKIRILEYIIKDYIATAEPVGSRTISKKYDLGLSSATIRNEMSDLEEMGYVLAPHASAGRIPSDKGYRLFVDRLLKSREQNPSRQNLPDLSINELRFLEEVIARNINQIDYLMRETAKAVSVLTNYTAVVSEAVGSTEKLSRLQLMPLDHSGVLLVTVTESKKIRNHSIRLAKVPDYDKLMSLSLALNEEIAKKGPKNLSPKAFARLKKVFAGHEVLLEACLAAAEDALSDLSDKQFYTSGIKNILAFPEFNDNAKARAIFEALEERDYLVHILEGAATEGLSVVIGQENHLLELKDCSVIKAPYSLEGDVHGSIAIIGPTRMDYSQTLTILQGMVKHLGSSLMAMEDNRELKSGPEALPPDDST